MPETRVTIVGLRGIPGVMGGVEAHCEELIPRLAALAPDLRFELIARSSYVRGGPRDYRGVIVRPLYAPRKASAEAIISTFIGVLRAFFSGARLVHIHGIGPALMAPLARLLGMRVIVTYHSLNYNHEKWSRFGRFMLRWGERCAAGYGNRIIAVAPWMAAHLRGLFPHRSQQIQQIPNGRTTFPEAGDGGAVLRELNLRPQSYVLAVGRLTPEKALPILVAGMKRAGWPNKLVICGGADHDTDYSRALLAEASEDCIFAGIRGKAALKTLYQNAALFVLPSEQEGMPIAALEAGSLGCPLLLSDIAPHRDLMLPDKHFFPAGDVEGLAARLRCDPANFAVADDLFARYDWDVVAEQTLAVYRSVLAN